LFRLHRHLRLYLLFQQYRHRFCHQHHPRQNQLHLLNLRQHLDRHLRRLF
jgi:hypothetical protein